MTDITIRQGRPDDADDIVSLLDRAMLSFDRTRVPSRIRRDAVVVAERNGNVRGAALLAGPHIGAIAVESSYRGEGIGRALVERVGESTDTVTAGCHPQATEFYASIGFSIYSLPSGRCFAYRTRPQRSGSTSS